MAKKKKYFWLLALVFFLIVTPINGVAESKEDGNLDPECAWEIRTVVYYQARVYSVNEVENEIFPTHAGKSYCPVVIYPYRKLPDENTLASLCAQVPWDPGFEGTVSFEAKEIQPKNIAPVYKTECYNPALDSYQVQKYEWFGEDWTEQGKIVDLNISSPSDN